MIRPTRFAPLLAVVALALAGCAAAPGPTGKPAWHPLEVAPSFYDSWALTSASDAAGAFQLGSRVLSAQFDQPEGEPDAIYGFAGCNGFNGSVDGGLGELDIHILLMTAAACVNAPAAPGSPVRAEPMETESRFLDALDDVLSSRIDGQELVLTGPKVSLVFVPDTRGDVDGSPLLQTTSPYGHSE